MEKDHCTAVIRPSSDFISIKNHDLSSMSPSNFQKETDIPLLNTLRVTGMEGLVEESVERNDCVVRMWQRSLKKSKNYRQYPHIRERDVIKLLDTYPVTNEETHFAIVMDPKAGMIIWLRQYVSPAFESVDNVETVDWRT
ncbi:MAG: hypothetical protein M1830_005809 [Pleopsidium flavum]|nr:MAG: hypothetical protein M1830_005809 [Pleopsidium flavum]